MSWWNAEHAVGGNGRGVMKESGLSLQYIYMAGYSGNSAARMHC